MEKHQYRATFILDTRDYKEPMASLISTLQDSVVRAEGMVQSVNDLGVKNFERVTNQKFSFAHYIQILFDGPSSSPKKLQEKLRLNKHVYRLLVETV